MRPRDLERDLHPQQTRPCTHGCSVRGEHHTDCADTDCTGCLPRPAKHGHLCPWCWQRLHADLVDIPHLIRHLRMLGEPTAAAKPPADGGTREDPAFRDALPPEWLTADELASTLTKWVGILLDEHPTRLNGPDTAGIWWTHSSLVTDDPDGPYVIAPKPVGTHTPDATDPIVKWFLPHLPWAAERDWIDDMRTDLADQVGVANARWPREERSRPVEIPCPLCDQRTLTYTPPTYPRASMAVVCENPDCGRIFGDQEWDRMRALIRMANARNAG